MNWEQVSGIIDRVVLVGLTYLVSRNIITAEESAGYATLIVSVIGAMWGWYNNRAVRLTARTDRLPEVAGVITKQTKDGRALARAVTSETVVVEATPPAAAVAKAFVP